MLIVVDPGHGGSDPGCVNQAAGLREKDLTLDIGKRIADGLTRHGFQVLMTRTSDVYVGLSQRAKMANDAKATYLLSVHINSGGGSGYESYVQPGYDSGETGRIRAAIHQRVAEFFASAGLPDRGRKQMDLAVCRETVCPASLFEYGFIDSNDAQKLADPAFRAGAAEATVRGLCEAFGVAYVPPGPAPQPADWKAVAMGWLKSSGLINQDHSPDAAVTWAEFGAVLSRIKEGK